MTSFDTIKIIGPTGAILIFLLFLSLYFACRSTIYLYIIRKEFGQYFAKIKKSGICVYNITPEKYNPLVTIVYDVIMLHSQKPSIDLREEIQYFFYRNFEHITKILSYLRFISVVSPLLGLLGTMLGMVKVFQTIATEAAPDSALLASGIWEALITTILGLCVAIPTLAFYYHLRLQLRSLHIEAVEHSVNAIALCIQSNQQNTEIKEQK